MRLWNGLLDGARFLSRPATQECEPASKSNLVDGLLSRTVQRPEEVAQLDVEGSGDAVPGLKRAVGGRGSGRAARLTGLDGDERGPPDTGATRQLVVAPPAVVAEPAQVESKRLEVRLRDFTRYRHPSSRPEGQTRAQYG